MFGINFDRQGAGRPISARTLNRPIRKTEDLARVRGGRGIGQVDVAGVPVLRDNHNRKVTVAKSTSTITGRSGTTLGTGSVRIYRAVGTSLVEGETSQALNLAVQTIASDKWLVLVDVDGQWLVDWVEC